MKKTNFNDNWLFSKQGDQKQAVFLPHDAMIREERIPECTSGAGNAYFPGGIYEYEKHFEVPEDWAEKAAILEFEGVYRNAKVYINGHEAGGKPYGYIPFFIEMTPYLEIGKMNSVRVVADNSNVPNSRWYSGGGIYRPVWLHLGAKKHILPEGVKITTLTYAPARIKVETEIAIGEIGIEVIDADGIVVANGTGNIVEIDIPQAKLWSDESPYLYQCRVTLTSGLIVDEVIESFGIRKVEWGTKGLLINGKETLLRGGCVHHDNGILGACCYQEAEERRVKIMKEVGYNAIRSAHNPISKAMMEACDKYGMYVMDELWDMWYTSKNKEDYSKDFPDNYTHDIEAMVLRDYNRPSVIMYSIGNEVSEPHEEKGLKQEKAIIDILRRFDNTRPITCGINLVIMAATAKGAMPGGDNAAESAFQMPTPTNSTMFNEMINMFSESTKMAASEELDQLTSPSLDMLDIAGYNYASIRYPLDGPLHPERVIVGAETFPMDLGSNWDMVKQYPYLIGDFMWTAWDYLGEVGLGAWAYTEDAITFNKPYPWLLADSGAIDILGNVGAEAEYASVIWGIRTTPYLGVRPVNYPGIIPAKNTWRGTNAIASWAWNGCEGNEAVVEVFADAVEVELLLNGESLGRNAIQNYRTEFNVTYVPGTLIAISYDKIGKELSRTRLDTPQGQPAIRVSPEKQTAKSGEIVYVNIDLAYDDGTVESNLDTKLIVSVKGGELLAFGSANPRSEECFHTGEYSTYYGRSLAIVKCNAAGSLEITAKGSNYSSKTVIIPVC